MELEDLLSDELLNWMQGDDAGAEIDAVLTAAIETHVETQSLRGGAITVRSRNGM